MKCVIILQARMGSSRLPGKSLMDLNGEPLVIRCVERLSMIDKDIPVVIATTDLPQDNPLVEIAQANGVPCFRGPALDVLKRYVLAAQQYQADWVIRATADNPWTDYESARILIHHFSQGCWAYANNIDTPQGKGLPIGCGLEMMRFDALQVSDLEGHESHHREHVNEYILENPQKFPTLHVPCIPFHASPHVSLTVDTSDDFCVAKKISETWPSETSLGTILPWLSQQTKH